MIRLYIVRHGIAVDPSEAIGSDESRPLTGKGRRRFRRAARAFSRLGETIDLLVSSPLVRAVQTAEILADALRIENVSISDELKPSQGVEAILSSIAPHLTDGQGVMLVSHDPLVSRLVAHAGDLTPVEGARVNFRKGSIVRIDVGSLPSARPAQARWWLQPKTRVLIQGLPLALPPGEKKKPAEKKPVEKKPAEKAPEPRRNGIAKSKDRTTQ